MNTNAGRLKTDSQKYFTRIHFLKWTMAWNPLPGKWKGGREGGFFQDLGDLKFSPTSGGWR